MPCEKYNKIYTNFWWEWNFMYTRCKLGRVLCVCACVCVFVLPSASFWGCNVAASNMRVALGFYLDGCYRCRCCCFWFPKRNKHTSSPRGRGLPLGPSHGWFMRSKCKRKKIKKKKFASREISKVFAPLLVPLLQSPHHTIPAAPHAPPLPNTEHLSGLYFARF